MGPRETLSALLAPKPVNRCGARKARRYSAFEKPAEAGETVVAGGNGGQVRIRNLSTPSLFFFNDFKDLDEHRRARIGRSSW